MQKTFTYTFPARMEEQMLVNHQRLGTKLKKIDVRTTLSNLSKLQVK